MNNLDYAGEITKINGQELTIKLYEELNVERLQTIFRDYKGAREVDLHVRDPRGFSSKQRSFAFALMQDIHSSNGQPIESLKEIFYFQFEALTGREISLKNNSENTMDDVALLCNLLLDFIFEENIPFRNYLVLPINRAHYFYKCIENRVCCVCGKTGADIDHFDKAVGRRKRNKIDHSEFTFAALCNGPQTEQMIQKKILTGDIKNLTVETINEIVKRGGHHAEKHLIGITEFKTKYHVEGVRLNQETIKRLRIGG